MIELFLYESKRGQANFLSEVVRCGASQKNMAWDSTKAYSTSHIAFGDVSQIAAYHKKLECFIHRENRAVNQFATVVARAKTIVKAKVYPFFNLIA